MIKSLVADNRQPLQRTNENPCARNCCLDDSNVCLGCGRRLAEILEWHHADPQRRAQIRQSAISRIAGRELTL